MIAICAGALQRRQHALVEYLIEENLVLWKKLGFELSPNTVKRILIDHGIEPAPERSKQMSWRTFLKSHWESLAACDFFTVEVLSWRGLVRYWLFFVIDLKSRRVEIAGIRCTPSGPWMAQITRQLTACEDGFLNGKTHLIMDRDPLYTAQVRQMLKDSGVKPVRLPPRSPKLNAIVPPERWGAGAIKKKERLGGTLQYYYRDAA